MMLIDLDEFFKKADEYPEYWEEQLNEMPTVDAVPVVRCKDCKYYIADGCDECALMNAKSIIAGINNKRWYSDFYCAWGERRNDETD